ncbi:MAG: PhnD/SsuA/transferrin family substrate-binding protein [Thermoanaerobaculaceae bacterium]
MRNHAAVTLLLLVSAGWAQSVGPVGVVVCAPGYPGSTAEAQPTMDLFASALARAAGLPGEAVAAVYHESEAAGVDRLRQPGAGLAMVPLAFLLAHGKELGLRERLQVVPRGGEPTEVWSLVAKKGRVTGPASLDGWELVSVVAYSPGFVGQVALAGWGRPPASVRWTASAAVLTGLRRAAAGEPVALLLDPQQAAALPRLPFASELEVVHRSRPLPTGLLCTVGPSAPRDTRVARLLAALPSLGSTPEGAAALEALRLTGFVPVDATALAEVRALLGGGT